LNRAGFCFYPRIPLPDHQPKSHASKLKPTTCPTPQTPGHFLFLKDIKGKKLENNQKKGRD